MDNKQVKLIHQRNILMLKLLWTGLALDVIVISFFDISHLLNIHVLIGILFCGIISLAVWKRKYIKQMMVVNVILIFVFFFILLSSDPIIANYIFIWFGLVITSLYQNSRLIWFAGSLTVILTNYFFLAYRNIIFPGVDLVQLTFINLFTVLIIVILVMTSRFSEKLRQKAEQNETDAVDELRTNKEYLESFINNTTDAIVAHDLKGNILRYNKAFEEMFGWTSQEPLGQILLTVPDDLLKETERFWEKVESGGQVSGFETLRLRKDKSIIDVSVTISPIRNNRGEIVSLACISRDITERKKTEDLLRKSEKLSAVGQLAAGVAHEVRNPLTTIKGFVQILQKRAPENEGSYEIMLSEVNRIESIINEYLLLAKPQVTKIHKKDFRELLQKIVKLVDTQAVLNKVQITTRFQSDIPLIECDENQIKQVFINIVQNAVDAMPDGGEINISVKMADWNKVLVRINDQGCGIPEERIAKLGEPFYTTKEKGTGLGLMVSYKIIENHRGSINVSSKPGDGTIVEVILPISQTVNG